MEKTCMTYNKTFISLNAKLKNYNTIIKAEILFKADCLILTD